MKLSRALKIWPQNRQKLKIEILPDILKISILFLMNMEYSCIFHHWSIYDVSLIDKVFHKFCDYEFLVSLELKLCCPYFLKAVRSFVFL